VKKIKVLLELCHFRGIKQLIIPLPCKDHLKTFNSSGTYIIIFCKQKNWFPLYDIAENNKSVNTKITKGRLNKMEQLVTPYHSFKLGSVIDSAGVLGHWVNGRTTESLVEPHDWTGTTRMTRLDDSVLD